MILSDNWIRAQCEKPTHIVRKINGGVEYASVPFTPSQTNLMQLKDLYRMTPIKTYSGNKPPQEYVDNGIPAIRVSEIFEITEEELANWKPMIEPFASGLVRTELREVSEDEKIAFNLSHPNFKDHPAYNPDWEMPEGGVIDINRGLMVPEKIISYGLSSYGYDLRIGNKFKIFTNINSTVLDPKNLDKGSFVDFEGDVCIIPPNSFVLAASMERVRMPRNVTGVVLGKSTYARTGIVCIATPLEAEWEGHVTLEFANTTPLPAMLYAGEGACQVLFFEGEQCLTSYLDRGGKYQNQEAGPVLPKV